MTSLSFKRRRYVVARRAQWRVAVWVLLHLAAVLALTLLLVLLPTLLRVASGGDPAGRRLDAGGEHVFLGWPAAAAVAAMLVVAVANSFALTNRVFGPLVRLEQVLRRWREAGAWPARGLQVRRRDFHAGLFEELDAAVAAAGADAAAAADRLRSAGERARALAERLGPGEDADRARGIAGECDRALEHLGRLAGRGKD